MNKTITALLSVSILLLSSSIVSSREVRTFGQQGNNGRNGIDGRNGKNNNDSKIIADGNSQTIDISGTNGEDASEGEEGNNAFNCKQPRNPPYFLRGANGGNGGSGGSGGDGGNGGDATIFYTDTANLKRITLDNSGGNGGNGGKGGNGGNGCQITIPHWQVKYCGWELWLKRTDIADSKWQNNLNDNKTTYCTGVQNIDAQSHTPPTPNLYSNVTYQWKYLGVTSTENYSGESGKQGQNGNNGNNGNNGRYGNVWLIPRMDIPTEKVSYSNSLANLIDKKIDLTKNIWINRQGLQSLLNSNSRVPNNYTYLLSTANLSYRILWTAKQTPTQLEINNLELGGKIVLDGTIPKMSLEANIPGTIEYQTKTQDNITTLTITGGFEPSRVKSYQVIDNNTDKKPHELILVDNGKVRELLTNTKFSVTTFIKQGDGIYRERDTVEFNLPPNKSSMGSMTVNNYQYTLNLGKDLFPWLKADSGYQLKHLITITQTTKRGVIYQQKIEYER